MNQGTSKKQTHHYSKQEFTTDVVQAIKDLEVSRRNRTPDELSDVAWEKLQFDLPVVEPAELAALVQKWRSSLQGKVSWPCYLLTQKALENIVDGSRRSTVRESGYDGQQDQLQRLLASSDSSSTGQERQHDIRHVNHAQDKGVSATANTTVGTGVSPTACTIQGLYKELCAVVFLQYLSKVLTLADEDAWQLLQDFQPAELQHGQHKHNGQVSTGKVSPQLQQVDMTDDEMIAAVMTPQPAPGTASTTGHAAVVVVEETCQVGYEATEAAAQDEDDDVYEPFEPLPAPPHVHDVYQHQQDQQQDYSWSNLHRKLLSIADQVHYSLIDYEPLWQQPASAADNLLQLVRTLGVHSHANDLQPLLAAYVNLLVDRIVAAPADSTLLQMLCAALGLTGQRSQLTNSSKARFGSQQHGVQPYTCEQPLPPEVVLGLSAAASVWQRVTGTSSRCRIWRMMSEHLLPLLEQCTEQLAYQSGWKKRASHADNVNGCAAAACHTQGTEFAHMLLVSHVIELVVTGGPATVDVAGQLTQLGVMRSLVQLFVQYATQPAAEPLRRALLLSCCSSQQTANWVLAVPALTQQLQQPELQLGGHAEAHGAIWEVLCSRSKGTAGVTAAAPSAAANGSSSSNSSGSDCQTILHLLELQPDDVQQLQRQVVLLQLMSDTHRAAKRHKLWDEAVVTAVKHFAGRVKQVQSAVHMTSADANTDAGTPDAKSSGTATTDSNSMTPQTRGVFVDGCGDGSDDDAVFNDDAKGLYKLGQQGNLMSADALKPRQLQRLWLVALRGVKELIAQANKTD